jgi:hypothetical protein
VSVKIGAGSTRPLSPADKSEIATTAFLDAGLKPPARIGITEYQTCPRCSLLHGKAWKRRRKCLAVTMENDWFGWICNACGWKGGSKYKNANRFVSKQNKQERDRKRKEKKRREAGATPRSQSKAVTRPWEFLGISKATYYRWLEKLSQAQQEIVVDPLRETNLSTTSDRPEKYSSKKQESSESLDSRDSL